MNEARVQDVGTIDPLEGEEWPTYSGSSYNEENLAGEKEGQPGAFYRWKWPPAICGADIATMSVADVRTLLLKFQNKLCELENLPSGWDDEDSPPPSPDILFAAESLMERLLLACSSNREPLDCHAEIPLPFASPVPGGALQFEWRSEQRYLELEFIDSNTVAFLLSENGWFKIGHVPVENTAEICRLSDWFMRP